ncbi:hypothetical protein AN161_19660 [Lysinibacillus sp. FJAT-14222]|nr:hypothetical protein AN161_19660 [Lysinibacillus sp. FJAT-14222]
MEGLCLQSEWNRANLASLSFLFGMIGALFIFIFIQQMFFVAKGEIDRHVVGCANSTQLTLQRNKRQLHYFNGQGCS